MALRKPSPSRAFFLELVLDLAVFALCAVVCLQVFAVAKTTSDRSAAATALGIEAQVLAEDFKALDGDVTTLAARISSCELEGTTLNVYYDKDLQVCTASQAVYVLSCEVDATSDVRLALISVKQGEDTLFAFTAARYVAPDHAPSAPAGGGA